MHLCLTRFFVPQIYQSSLTADANNNQNYVEHSVSSFSGCYHKTAELENLTQILQIQHQKYQKTICLASACRRQKT